MLLIFLLLLAVAGIVFGRISMLKILFRLLGTRLDWLARLLLAI